MKHSSLFEPERRGKGETENVQKSYLIELLDEVLRLEDLGGLLFLSNFGRGERGIIERGKRGMRKREEREDREGSEG